MWYQNASKTSRQEDNCSKAHVLLAIIEMEGMEIWQARETRKFCWPLFSYCLEGFMFSNIKLIILCNLFAKKPVMCEFTTTSETLSKLQLKLSTLLQCFAKRNMKFYILTHRWSQCENRVEFGEGSSKCKAQKCLWNVGFLMGSAIRTVWTIYGFLRVAPSIQQNAPTQHQTRS